MALGLSVIFGVVRVVNFAHGEMMTIAMYLAIVAVPGLQARSAGDDGADRGRAVRARLRDAGGADQSVRRPARAFAVHAAGRDRDHHGQRAAADLRARRAQRADVLLVRQLRVRPHHRRRHQGLCGRRGDRGVGRAVCLLPLQRYRQGDPRLRRQLHRRAGGRAEREAALCADLRARRRLRRRGRLDARADHRRDAAARARTTRCSPSSSSSSAGSARCRARCSAAC